MHDDEHAIDAELVRALLTSQFPEFAGLQVRAVQSTGTVNAIFRLGDELCVRLPRTASWADDIEAECRWLPELAPHLSLAVPEPVAKGTPGAGYPYSWAIYRWIDAVPYSDELVIDERQAAVGAVRCVSSTIRPAALSRLRAASSTVTQPPRRGNAL